MTVDRNECNVVGVEMKGSGAWLPLGASNFNRPQKGSKTESLDPKDENFKRAIPFSSDEGPFSSVRT